MFQLNSLPRTIDAAERDASHPRRHVREGAVRDLSRLAATDDVQLRDRALSVLTRVLAQDQDARVRGACALAFADAQADSALAALLTAARDDHPHVVEMALVAIRELSPRGHRRASALIQYHLTSPAAALRFQALTAASRVLDEGFESVALQALHDADAKLRYLALRVCEERWPPGQLPESLRGAASKHLTDADAATRVAAALLLAPQGDKAATTVLVDAINSRARLPSPEDEQALIEAAGELGLQAAVPGLRLHRRGRFGLVPGRFAWQAQVALARLGDPQAVDAIRRGLRSRNADVRTLSVTAVGRARLGALRPELERLVQTGRAPSETVAEALAALRDADLER